MTPPALPLRIDGRGRPLDEVLGEAGPRLRAHGAGLIEGSSWTTRDLTAAVAATLGELGDFTEESSPRTRVGDHLYSSTDYPSAHPIQFHSEYSYAEVCPRWLVFACVRPAATGGATLVAHNAEVLERIGADIVDDFARRGVLYARTYRRGLGVPWSVAFGTDDRHAVTALCSRRGIASEWEGDVLRTFQTGAALARAPHTGATVWFNHALNFSVHSAPEAARRVLLAMDVRDRPVNTSFGDGEPIGPDVVDAIAGAYATGSKAVQWRSGDVLVIDNVAVAHGRAPFTGSREVIVTMAGPQRTADLALRGTGSPDGPRNR